MKKLIAVMLASTCLLSCVSPAMADNIPMEIATRIDPPIIIVEDTNNATILHDDFVHTSYDTDITKAKECPIFIGSLVDGSSYVAVNSLNGQTIVLDGEEYTIEATDGVYDDTVGINLKFIHYTDDSKTFEISVPRENFKIKESLSESETTEYNVLEDYYETIKFTTSFIITENVKLNTNTMQVLASSFYDTEISLSFLRELGATISWDGTNPYILNMPSVSPYIKGKKFTVTQLSNYVVGNLNNDGTPVDEVIDLSDEITKWDVPQILDILGKISSILSDETEEFYVRDVLVEELNKSEVKDVDNIVNGFVSSVDEILKNNNNNTPYEDLLWDIISKALDGLELTICNAIDNLSDEEFNNVLDTAKQYAGFMMMVRQNDTEESSEDNKGIAKIMNNDFNIENLSIDEQEAFKELGFDIASNDIKENLSKFKEDLGVITGSSYIEGILSITTRDDAKALIKDTINTLKETESTTKRLIKYMHNHPDEFLN